MDVKTQQVMQKVAEQATKNQAEEAATTKEVENSDVSRFDNAMQNQGQNESLNANAGQQVQGAQNDQNKTRSVGDTILDNLHHCEDSWNNTLHTTSNTMETSNTTNPKYEELLARQTKMLELQTNLATKNIEVQITTSGSNKTNQGLQALLKGQ